MLYTNKSQYPDLAKQINIFLSKWGINPKGEPLFRLVWGPDQTEKRYGEFNIFDSNTKQLIRVVRDIKEVKKYWYLPATWVIEIWNPPYINNELEDGGVNGTYEPLYVYASGLEPLPLHPIVAEIVVFSVLSPTPSPALIKSMTNLAIEEKDKLEDKYFNDIADEVTVGDGISDRLYLKSGVSMHYKGK